MLCSGEGVLSRVPTLVDGSESLERCVEKDSETRFRLSRKEDHAAFELSAWVPWPS